ncbi:EF-hand domain-containing protein [Streptomyces sp. NBC_01433]|uniref:EF-hand domain-containing protein n=1 Tax=Streptomyces sp. NBC_01433 TaxID=2903864 RepID=UPI00225C2EDD|nr:EF-hand domain-containing protein [Streptomyces sp. NBC_01433]MCX4679281.1 EF-hand domain-containing protein [Streptomyces sp. NBC_01433]
MTEGGGHAIFDVNGDNEIAEDEFTRFARFLMDVGMSDAPDAMDTFTMLDTDRDGPISRQEFILAVLREAFVACPGP